ncbi:hypothetical protein M0805_005191 [Coniferiporia weirii]|nr:hypothetical protein M0805_005191 [Coniferiporia weirii]
MDTRYADACVQTSPILSATRFNDGSDISKAQCLSRERLKRVTYAEDSSYEAATCARRVFPRTPVNRMKTFLPSNCSPLAVQAQAQRRLVSLPEQLGLDVLAEKLARSLVTGSRSVSMPSHLRQFVGPNSRDESVSVQTSSSLPIDEGDSSRLRTYSNWLSDLPNTPSSPSTPDSIEIIENSFHLSDTFLRTRGGPTKPKEGLDEDWISWAHSPPRPIPALHGPASLPYARCPSGAEGTVIEEPSTVPGLIWGLEEDGSTALTQREAQLPSGTIDTEMQARLNSVASKYSHPRFTSSAVGRHVLGAYATIDKKSDAYVLDEISYEHTQPYQPALQTIKVSQVQERLDLNSTQMEESLRKWVNKRDLNSKDPMDLRTYRKSVSDPIIIPRPVERSRVNHFPTYLSDGGDPFNSLAERRHMQIPTIQHKVHRGHSVSNTLVSKILRETHTFKDKTNLDASAPTFVPGHLRMTSDTKNGLNTSEEAVFTTSVTSKTGSSTQSVRPHEHHLSERCCLPSTTLPTPPDSTSPQWSSKSSPYLSEDPSAATQANHRDTSSRNLGLNLLTPAARFEELSEQLRQLTLQQQRNCEAIESLNHGRPFFANQISSQGRCLTGQELILSKPSMPINLPDLVARRTPVHSPVIPALPTTLFSPGNSNSAIGLKHCKETPTLVHCANPAPNSSNDNSDYRAGSKGALTGRRHPRSIPLTRLLEKKLASVPEEMSTVDTISQDTDSLAQSDPGANVVAEQLTKNVAPLFTQNQSSVAEAWIRQPLKTGSQAEVLDLPFEHNSKALDPLAKPKRRQATRARSPSDSSDCITRGGKISAAGPLMRNNEDADVKALKKKNKAGHKTTSADESAKKSTATQRVRRKT